MSAEVSLSIIAGCLIILIAFILSLIIGLFIAFHKLKKSAAPLLEQAAKTTAVAHEIAVKIKTNIELADPLFSSISKIGRIMETFFNQISSEKKRDFHPDLDSWVEWLGWGIILWKKIKKEMDK